MRPPGTAVRFALVYQIVVKETSAATPRAALTWERYMREVEHVAVFGVDAPRQKGKVEPVRNDWVVQALPEFADGAACAWMA
jgi:hypothetical protein